MSRRPSPLFVDHQNPGPSAGVITLPRRRIVFGWYGGKFNHLNWLLPLLPECHHYCEPFAGSAAVLVNRPPSPVETYNDIDGEVVNFFRVLRDKKDELVEAIGLTPFSREEFFEAVSTPPLAPPHREEGNETTALRSGDIESPVLGCDPHPSPLPKGEGMEISDVERARRFFIRARQVRTGLAQTASLGRWANCKNTSRNGMSGVVSRWLGSVEMLPEIAERLLRVQIENRPAADVIRLYDSPDTLFYCDPPYLHESRGDSKAYGFEMTGEDHRQLAALLHTVQGKAAISGYRCDTMDSLYADWRCIEAPEKTCHSVKQPRREALWTNY